MHAINGISARVHGVYKVFPLLLLISATFCGEGARGIDSLQLFVDHRLGCHVDNHFHPDPFRNANGAFVLEGGAAFKILSFTAVPVEFVELHIMVNSTNDQSAALAFPSGSGRIPESDLVQEVTFELGLSAGEFVFTVYAKEENAGIIVAESGTFMVTGIPQSSEMRLIGAAPGCARVLRPNHQSLVLLASEQDCINVTVSFEKCAPARRHMMASFVNGNLYGTFILGPDAPAACISGFRTGLNDVTVQFTSLGEAETEETHSLSFKLHVKMGPWWHQGEKRRPNGLDAVVHRSFFDFLPQLQDLMQASFFGTAGSERAEEATAGKHHGARLPGRPDAGASAGGVLPQDRFDEADSEVMVSLVLVARNDARDDAQQAEALARLHTSVEVFRAFAEEEHVSAEVLVVDYNPAPGTARCLSELSQSRPEDGTVPVRVIVVPASAHEEVAAHLRAAANPPDRGGEGACEEDGEWREWCAGWSARRCREFLRQPLTQHRAWAVDCAGAERCSALPPRGCCRCWQSTEEDRGWAGEAEELPPVLQGVANNVGARRARGKFVLFGGYDTIFSRNVFQWLRGGWALEDAFYCLGESRELRQGDGKSSTRGLVAALSEGLLPCESRHVPILSGEEGDVLSGAEGDVLLVSRRALWAVHGFAELPLVAHSRYMLLRLAAARYPLLVLRHSVAFHSGPAVPPPSPRGGATEVEWCDSHLDLAEALRKVTLWASPRADPRDHACALGAVFGENWGFPFEAFAETTINASLAAGSGNAEEAGARGGAVLTRHPAEVMCVILAQMPVKEAPGIYSAPFAVLGAVVGCRYRATLLLWSRVYGTILEEVWVWLQMEDSSDNRDFQVTTPSLGPGQYTFVFTLFDAFPGLDEDGSFIAVKRRMLQVEAPVAPRTRMPLRAGDAQQCSLATTPVELKQSMAASVGLRLDCAVPGATYAAMLTILSSDYLATARPEARYPDELEDEGEDMDAAEWGEGQPDSFAQELQVAWRGTEEWLQQDGDGVSVVFLIPPLPVLNYTLVFTAHEAGNEDEHSALAKKTEQVEVQRWTAITCFDEHCRCEKDASCKTDEETDSIDWSAMDVVGNPSLLQDWIETSGRFYRGDFDASILSKRAQAEQVHIPVAVMNLPSEKQRRRHMRRLLAALSFSNISFPPATLAHDLNLTDLYETGWLAPEAVPLMTAMPWIGEGGLKSYVANAVGQLMVIERHVIAGTPGFIVMEDDLMPTAQPEQTRVRIQEAVNEVRQIDSADILYLEMCFESCSRMGRRREMPRIAKAFRPYCTGAIFYTQKGARRVLEMCKPVVAAIDNMLPRLIERGMLEAYGMVPPAFVQDSFFGTSVSRNLFQSMLFTRQHFPLAPPCFENSLQLEDVRSAAFAYAPAQLHDVRYLSNLRQLGDHALVECGDQTSLFVVSLGKTFCKDAIPVPGLVELRVQRHDYATAWATAGSELTVFVMPNPAQKVKWCFLVDSDKLIDVTSLRGDQSEVLLLVRGAEDREATPAAHVLFAAEGSIAEFRLLLLEEALVRFASPLLRFSWFVWCGGNRVLDGACVEQARTLSDAGPDPPFKAELPQGGFGAVWWEHIGEVVKERRARDGVQGEAKVVDKAERPPVITHPKAGASTCSDIVVTATGGERGVPHLRLFVDNKEVLANNTRAEGPQFHLRNLSRGRHLLELVVFAPGGCTERRTILFQHWVLFYVQFSSCDASERVAQGAEARPDVLSWSRQLEVFLFSSLAVGRPTISQNHLPEGVLRDSFGILFPLPISQQLSAAFPARVQNGTLLSPDLAFGPSEEAIESASMISAVERTVAREGPGSLFVFADLGAGFGRKGVRATLLGRKFGIRTRTVSVEADLNHLELLRACFDLNGLRAGSPEHRLVKAAVSGANGRSNVVVGAPLRWWGQALAVAADTADGTSSVEVELVSLKSVLDGEGAVHLVHVDVQGAELGTLTAAADDGTLAQVQELLVKTYSFESHWGLVDLFCRMQWHSVAVFEPEAARGFSYKYKGHTWKAEDGVQVWLNPALVDINTELGSTTPVSCEGFTNTWPVMHLGKEEHRESLARDPPQDHDEVPKGSAAASGDVETVGSADADLTHRGSSEREENNCFPSNFLEYPVLSSCASGSAFSTSLTVCSPCEDSGTEMECLPLDHDHGHWVLEYGESSEAVAVDDFRGGKLIMHLPDHNPDSDHLRKLGVSGRKRTAMWVTLLKETCASNSRVVVDAACGMGYHALLALAHGCHVVCIEPDPELAGHLARSVVANSFHASIVIVVAVPGEAAGTTQLGSCRFRRWDALGMDLPAERASELRDHRIAKQDSNVAVVAIGTLLRGRAAVVKMDVDGGCEGDLVRSLEPWLSEFGFDSFVGEASDAMDDGQIGKFAVGCNGTVEGSAWVEDWELGCKHEWKSFWVTEFRLGQLPPSTKDVMLKCHGGRTSSWSERVAPTTSRAGCSPMLYADEMCGCDRDSFLMQHQPLEDSITAARGSPIGASEYDQVPDSPLSGSPRAARPPVCECIELCVCEWEEPAAGSEGSTNSATPHYGEDLVSIDYVDRFPQGRDILAGVAHASALTSEGEIKGGGFSFPAFVISDPKEATRRRQARRVLQALGIRSVTFPPYVSHTDINVSVLFESGELEPRSLEQLKSVPWVGSKWRQVLSLALNHLRCLRKGLESGSELFAVFEDDLMLVASPEASRQRLQASLRELPPTADVLYLEFCYETCANLTFHRRFQHVVPAVSPSCTAAMVFSRHGAARILAAMHPVFLALDNMYAALITTHRLHAFLAFPPILAQDGFWASSIRGSQVRRVHSSALPGRTHRPFSVLCHEDQNEPWAMSAFHVLPPNLHPSLWALDVAGDAGAQVLVSSDEFVAPSFHEEGWADLQGPDAIARYYTMPRLEGECGEAGGQPPFCVQIGSNRLAALAGAVTLQITEASECWHALSSCTILVVIGNRRHRSVVERMVRITDRMLAEHTPQHALLAVLLPSRHRSAFSAPPRRRSPARADEVALLELADGSGMLEQLLCLTRVPLSPFDYVAFVGASPSTLHLPGLTEVLRAWRPTLGLVGRVDRAGGRTQVVGDVSWDSSVVWVVAQEELARLWQQGGLRERMGLDPFFTAMAAQINTAWPPSGFAWRVLPLCESSKDPVSTAAASFIRFEVDNRGRRQAAFDVGGDLPCSVALVAAVAQLPNGEAQAAVLQQGERSGGRSEDGSAGGTLVEGVPGFRAAGAVDDGADIGALSGTNTEGGVGAASIGSKIQRHRDVGLCALRLEMPSVKASLGAIVRVRLDCATAGAKYRMTMRIKHRGLQVCEVADEWVEGVTDVAAFRSLEFPALLPARYSAEVVATEAFHGIDPDEAILAARRTQIEVKSWAPISCLDFDCTCHDDFSCQLQNLCQKPDLLKLEIESKPMMLADWLSIFSRFHRGDFNIGPMTGNIHIAVAVMNLRTRPDRKSHMKRLLAHVGFQNVNFPATVLSADIDLVQECAEGWLTAEAIQFMTSTPWIGKGGLLSYIANAKAQLKVIEDHIRAGEPNFIVMEDDLMPTADPALVRRRILQAVSELPKTADLLYMEMCFESCNETCSVGTTQEIARATRPKCTGAILYTSKGAEKVISLCKPIFAALDNMLPWLIERGMLEAYFMVPPAFAQDSFFGTSVSRPDHAQRKMTSIAQHFPVAPPCRGRGHMDNPDFIMNSVALEIAESQDDDFRYLVTVLQIDTGDGLIDCEDGATFLHLAWLKIFCSTHTGVGLRMERVEPPGWAEDNFPDLDSIMLFVMPLVSETRLWCFLVRDDDVDIERLQSAESKVVVRDRGHSRPERSTSRHDEQERIDRELLDNALQLFLNPLVKFSWFVWCDGQTVQTGNCLHRAHELLEIGEGREAGTGTSGGGFRAVWWEDISDTCEETHIAAD